MEDEIIDSETEIKVSYEPLYYLFAAVIIIWFLAWHLTGSSFSSWDVRGTFGDMFGAINSLFSGLAFAGVIFAIFLQRKELELQRKEVVQTRKELRGQKEAQEKQNFDNTFFQLVRFQNEIVNSINLTKKGMQTPFPNLNLPTEELFGRDCFEYLYEIYSKQYFRLFEATNDEHREKIHKSYEQFFKKYQSDLGHYFRNLYNIFRIIDSSSYNLDQKKFYSSIIRGQISNYELLLLFYDGLWASGYNFIQYIVRYELFDNMPMYRLINQEHIQLYEDKAYGDQLVDKRN